MSPTRRTPEQIHEARRRRGTALCQRLARDVAALTPPGIGTWPRTWEIVADADARLLTALAAWEADATEANRRTLRDRTAGVLDAWRQAAAEYVAHRYGMAR
jgi:hypothetical protein